MSLPIACSLTDSALQERRREVLQNLKTSIVEIRELEDGFAYRFSLDDDRMLQLARFVEAEHQCCPFLRFRITVESGDDFALLELTGPQGTKEFIETTFAF